MRRGHRTWMGVLCLLLGTVGAAPRATTPVADSVPTCDYPQAIAPFQAFGANVYPTGRVSTAWNGSEFGVSYADGSNITFRRYYADGTPAAPPVILANSGIWGGGQNVPILWNGFWYAVAWVSSQPSLHIAFGVLDANGAFVYGPTTVTTGTSWQTALSLATSGSGYAVAWHDIRSGDYDVYASLINADGTIGGGGSLHDIAVGAAANHQTFPSLAWSIAGYYLLVWQDVRSVTKVEIYANTLTPAGTAGTAYMVVSGASSSFNPWIASAGGPFCVTWSDVRDGNYEVYFARLDASGTKLGTDVRLTNNASNSNTPFVTWTGGEYGIFWRDSPSGGSDTYFQRVSLAGAAQGSALQLMAGAGTSWPAAAFGTRGYMVVTCNSTNWSGFLQPVGCAYPSAPPCPENALAYAISGTQATIAWLPVVDGYFDVAYYQVYRNNTLLGLTSQNVYTDTGLALNTTYNYSIRTVNAGQLISTGCPAGSSVYVKTNASLLLMVDKSDPSAALTWTDSDPLNSYNVYRGTSPQVMQQIGTTSGSAFSDAGVLRDNILYFYTVDDPGQ